MSDEMKKYIESIDESITNNIKDTSGDLLTNKLTDLSYFNFDIKDFPCGMFYDDGTVIMVRPATVKEIQYYSMVDDNNIYDIIEKMNHMIHSCVKIKYRNGTIKSYLDLKDQDRLYTIFLIKELTFQNSNSLTVKTTCPHCGSEQNIEMCRKNFIFYKPDDNLMKFFDSTTKTFKFELKNGKYYELAPPNIGLQKSFTEYIIKETQEKRQFNLSFLKIIPFMLIGRNSISIDEIKNKLKQFESMDDISFQFLNSVIDKMTFGIKELHSYCTSCGGEVRTEMSFPSRASSLFIIHNAFETYIKE